MKPLCGPETRVGRKKGHLYLDQWIRNFFLRCEDSANYETNITMRKQINLKSFNRPVDLCGKEFFHCQGKGKRLHCQLAILPLTAF